MTRPRAFDGFPAELRCEYGPYMGVIDDHHDGDTLAVQLDPGFDESPVRWIRLKGVLAPELWEPFGPQLADFIASVAPPGTACRVATEKTPVSGAQRKSFERYSGTVELTGGRDLGELVRGEMRRLGIA